MRRELHYSLILTAVLIMPFFAVAQSFDLSGELRPRFENRRGYKQMPAGPDEAVAFVSQRSRINALYSDDHVRVGFSLQDVRVWGEVPQLNTTDFLFSVHEAWGELLFSSQWSLKAGRQEIVYDDSRIFGNVNWAQQARSHDAALIKFQSNKLKVHSGLAINQDAEKLFSSNYSYGRNNYKNFQYLWGNYADEKWEASALVLNTGIEATYKYDPLNHEIVNYTTIGGRAVVRPGNAMVSLAGYLQTGKVDIREDINGSYFKVDAGYIPDNGINVSAGYEFLSGNDQGSGDDENNAFIPVFGTNHKFNGWMDYFYVGNHANSVGLNDLYVKAGYTREDFSTSLTAHIFSAVGNVWDSEDPENSMDAALGTEFDYTASYKYSDNAAVSAGYSRMFGTETLEALRGGDADEAAHWFWMMISIKPKFL